MSIHQDAKGPVSYSDNDRRIAKALLTHHSAVEAAEALGLSVYWVREKRRDFIANGVLKEPEPSMSVEKGKNFKDIGL